MQFAGVGMQQCRGYSGSLRASRADWHAADSGTTCVVGPPIVALVGDQCKVCGKVKEMLQAPQNHHVSILQADLGAMHNCLSSTNQGVRGDSRAGPEMQAGEAAGSRCVSHAVAGLGWAGCAEHSSAGLPGRQGSAPGCMASAGPPKQFTQAPASTPA